MKLHAHDDKGCCGRGVSTGETLGAGGEITIQRGIPGIGEFQCYDAYMMDDLKRAAEDVSEPEWCALFKAHLSVHHRCCAILGFVVIGLTYVGVVQGRPAPRRRRQL